MDARGTSATTELTSDETADYLLGSLDVSGAAFEDRRASALRALEWLRHLHAYGYEAIPFFVVHDVGHLLLSGDAFPFRAVTDLERWTDEERAPRLAYENRFLNALRSDSRFRRFMQILAQQDALLPAAAAAADGGEAKRLDALVQRALEILFAGARESPLTTTPRLNPVHLRDLALFPDGVDRARSRFEERRPGVFLRQLTEFLAVQAPLVEIARLVREEDFFELAHFEALDRPHRRLFARRVQELVSAAGPIDVSRTRVRVETQEASTMVADEGTYPTGGIGEITTKGSIENLVRSELVYRDDSAEVDLFALRWAEGDLLFYTRDSGALHRKRRALVFVIEPGKLRIKDPRHSTSLAVLAYSLVARAADDLLELFGGEGAHVDLRIVSASAGDADREEKQLFDLRLREAVRRGDARTSIHPAADATTLVDPRRRTFVIALGDVAVDGQAVERLGGTLLRVRLAPPPSGETRTEDEGEPSLFWLDPTAKDPGERIAELRDALMARVVGVR